MSCDKFKDRYEAYALGILEGAEFEELLAHLESGCPICSKALNREHGNLATAPLCSSSSRTTGQDGS